MMYYTTAETAIQLVISNFEMNHIACDTASIRNRVYGWYEHSDVTDPEMLAACALMGIDWSPEVTYQMMVEAKEWWFPQDPYEGTSIWEIEAAQCDMMWWR